MYNDTDSIQILSRKPLWFINEEGQIGYIQNTYSDAEVVRVIKNTHITNYPITEYLTVIPELNTVLFETQEYAIIGLAMMEDSGNQDLLLNNAAQVNIHSECYTTNGNIQSGLYSYSVFDRLVEKPVNVMEVRYLDRNEKIKKIHESDELPRLNDIINEYIRFEDIQQAHHNVRSERLVFDILCENNKVWIKHFWIVDNGVDIGPIPFMVSPLNGFLMFTSKPNAAYYRNDVREGLTSPFYAMVGEGQQKTHNAVIRQQIKEQKKSAVKMIVSGVKDIVTTFVSTDQIFGFVTNKATPNIIHAYKKFMRKYKAKKRKTAFLERQKTA